jgi:hypothetical protein
VLLASGFPGEAEGRIRSLIGQYVDEATADEWPRMAAQSASLTVAPRALSEALRLVLALSPKGDGQISAQHELITALEDALDARRQRIIVSQSSVNWVKWLCLIAQALCTLVAIAVIHHDNRGANAIAMGIFATGVALSLLLIASHDRPFTGEISVKADLLQQARPTQSEPGRQ